MNPNTILALLERKGVITRDEAQKVSDHIAQSPQSTYYPDAFDAVTELIGEPISDPILPHVDMTAKEEKPADVKPVIPADTAKKVTDKKSK